MIRAAILSAAICASFAAGRASAADPLEDYPPVNVQDNTLVTVFQDCAKGSKFAWKKVAGLEFDFADREASVGGFPRGTANAVQGNMRMVTVRGDPRGFTVKMFREDAAKPAAAGEAKNPFPLGDQPGVISTGNNVGKDEGKVWVRLEWWRAGWLCSCSVAMRCRPNEVADRTKEAIKETLQLAEGLDAVLATHFKQGDTSLRASVKRVTHRRPMLADAGGESEAARRAIEDMKKIPGDLERIIKASEAAPQALADILTEELKDEITSREVWNLVCGRLDGIDRWVGMKVGNWAWSDKRILKNLRAKLPADSFLIRYFRSRDREEDKARDEFFRAEAGTTILLVLVDVAAGLSGFPTPSAILAQADMYKPWTKSVELGGWLTEDTGKHFFNHVTNMQECHILLSAAWSICSAWADKINEEKVLPVFEDFYAKMLDTARERSEHEWFTKMNLVFQASGYELRRNAVLLADIDAQLKAKGANRSKPDGVPAELRELAAEGNRIDAWGKRAVRQVAAAGYYSGWEPDSKRMEEFRKLFANPAAPATDEKFLRGAVEKNPDSPDAHFRLGEHYARNGKLDDAEKSLNECLRLKPAHAPANAALGSVHERRGRLPEAEQCYRRAADLAPTDPAHRLALARALASQGKNAEADAQRREAAKLSAKPTDPAASGNPANTGAAAFAKEGNLAPARWEIRGAAAARGTALAIEGGKLKAAVSGAAGSAHATLADRLRGDFELQVDYSMDGWEPDKLLFGGLGIRLESEAGWTGDRVLMVDRAVQRGKDVAVATVVGAKPANSEEAGLKTVPTTPAGTFRIRRQADKVRISHRTAGSAEWTDLGETDARLSPELSLWISVSKRGRGNLNVTVHRVEVAAQAK